MSTEILMLKLTESFVLKCRDIYFEVYIDIDDEDVGGDDEEVEL